MSPRTNTLTKRASSTKDILHAAAKVFRQKGYFAGTIDDIARELKATKGTVYYYFKAKADILHQLHIDHLRSLQQILRKAHRGKGRLSVETRLRQALQDIISLVYRDIDQSAVINQTITELRNEYVVPATFWEEVRRDREEVERLLEGLVVEGVEQGVFRPCNPALTTKFILGVLNWLNVWLDPHGPLDEKQMSKQIAAWVLGGLNGASPPVAAARGVRRQANRRKSPRPNSYDAFRSARKTGLISKATEAEQ